MCKKAKLENVRIYISKKSIRSTFLETHSRLSRSSLRRFLANNRDKYFLKPKPSLLIGIPVYSFNRVDYIKEKRRRMLFT